MPIVVCVNTMGQCFRAKMNDKIEKIPNHNKSSELESQFVAIVLKLSLNSSHLKDPTVLLKEKY